LTTAAKDSALLSFCCRGAKDSVFKSHRPPRKKLGFYQCFGESDRDNCQKLSFNQLLSGGAEELSFSGSFSRPRKTWTLSMFGKATEISAVENSALISFLRCTHEKLSFLEALPVTSSQELNFYQCFVLRSALLRTTASPTKVPAPLLNATVDCDIFKSPLFYRCPLNVGSASQNSINECSCEQECRLCSAFGTMFFVSTMTLILVRSFSFPVRISSSHLPIPLPRVSNS